MGCAAPHWAAHGLDGDRGDPRGSQWRRAQRRAADGALGATVLHIAMPHLTILTTDVAWAASNSARRLTAIWPGWSRRAGQEPGRVSHAMVGFINIKRLELYAGEGTAPSVEYKKPVVETRSPAPGGHDGHRAQRPRCAPISASKASRRGHRRGAARAQWGIIQWDGVSCHHLPWRLFPANTQRPTPASQSSNCWARSGVSRTSSGSPMPSSRRHSSGGPRHRPLREPGKARRSISAS